MVLAIEAGQGLDAAILGVDPPAREAPMAESSIVASKSPAQGTVSSSEQQVAKLEPYSPATAPLEDEAIATHKNSQQTSASVLVACFTPTPQL